MNPHFPPDFPHDDFFHPRPFFSPRPPLPADEELAMRVADQLKSYLASPLDRVLVEVQNRVVILEGVVATAALRKVIHRLVWRESGVADVCSRLITWDDGEQRR